MLKHLRILVSVGVLGLSLGCAPRVVVINSQSDVVRIGPKMRGYVYTQDAKGEWVKAGKVTLPEGWYAGPMPEE